MHIAKVAIESIIEEKMVENSVEVGAYMEGKLRGLKSPLIKEIRARGLFQGLELNTGHGVDGNDFTKIMFRHGLLTKATHDMTVRFTPALVI